MPPSAAADAFRIGYASDYGIDYLLTWNCRHIANAERWSAIARFLADAGLPPMSFSRNYMRLAAACYNGMAE